jgi:phosphoglycolate phosphatase-like HAD superfamily hydrolase
MSVFCFDFDGVVCDSAPETGLSAWHACRELWPEMPEAPPPAVLDRFCRLRPVLHTGYEAIPLMRLIAQDAAPDEGFFARWPAMRDEWMHAKRLDKDDLQRRFGAQRDRMIAEDAAGWLALNPFYPGMAELLADVIRRHDLFIITTKQERFAQRLLSHNQLFLPPERIFGLERNRSKPEILTHLLARPGLAGRPFHFIEDRLETLLDVAARPELNVIRLYLADWGYNTPRQRAQAAREPRIELVSLKRLRHVCAG